MPCNKLTGPHEDSAEGVGKECEKAKENARRRALDEAQKWAMDAAGECPPKCPYRVIKITLTPGTCEPTDHDNQKTKCGWKVTIECAASAFTPAGKTEIPAPHLIACDDFYTKHGTADGTDPLGGKAESAAVKAALDAAKDAAVVVSKCNFGTCPHLSITISIGAPSAPVIVPGTGGALSEMKSTCSWQIVAECNA